MKYGNIANKKAQAKARRLIGPKALVAFGGLDYIPEPEEPGKYKASAIYQVGEFHGVGDFRIHGESPISFRQAFEAAGIYDPDQIKNSRI